MDAFEISKMNEANKRMKLKGVIEETMAEVAGLPAKKHKNLLGSKWKYITALVDKLCGLYEEKEHE